MSTQASRGIEISCACSACSRSAEKRAIMIASERPSGSSPFARWPRVSDPTRRKVTGSSDAVPSGVAGAGRLFSSRPLKTSLTRSTLPPQRDVRSHSPPPITSARTRPRTPRLISTRRSVRRRSGASAGPAAASSWPARGRATSPLVSPVRNSSPVPRMTSRGYGAGQRGVGRRPPPRVRLPRETARGGSVTSADGAGRVSAFGGRRSSARGRPNGRMVRRQDGRRAGFTRGRGRSRVALWAAGRADVSGHLLRSGYLGPRFVLDEVRFVLDEVRFVLDEVRYVLGDARLLVRGAGQLRVQVGEADAASDEQGDHDGAREPHHRDRQNPVHRALLESGGGPRASEGPPR